MIWWDGYIGSYTVIPLKGWTSTNMAIVTIAMMVPMRALKTPWNTEYKHIQTNFDWEKISFMDWNQAWIEHASYQLPYERRNCGSLALELLICAKIELEVS